MNNPMNYTDPTGYSWLSDNWRTVASIAITAFAPYAWGAIGTTLSSMTQAVITGMVSGAVQSGTLKGALMGGFSAGMFNGIGAKFETIAKGEVGALGGGGALNATGVAAKIGAHAVAGGVMSVLQGGKFGHGFISAGVVEAIGPKALAMAGKNEAAQIVAAAVVGGTASRLAGGKFANGAVTGAFQWAFNEMAHGQPPVDSSLEGAPGYQSDYVEPPESSMFASGMEGDLTIYSQRYTDGADFTISRAWTSDNKWEGYFLEPAGPSSTAEGSDLRIPAGTYAIKYSSGAVFKNAFEITGVTGRSAILIHAGNSGGDTLGCFLPGNTVGATQVFGSAPARDSLYNLIRQYNAPKIKVMENEN